MAQIAMAALSAFGKSKDSVDGFKKALGVATAGLSAFTAAGLVGTTEGNRLSEATRQLSQTFASMFMPVVERVSGALEQFNAWLDGSGGKLQEAFGAVTDVMFDYMENVVAEWAPVVEQAMESLAIILKEVVVPVLKLFSDVLLALVKVQAWFVQTVGAGAASKAFNEEFGDGGGKKAMQRVTLSGGKFEDVTATFKRLQSAAAKTDTGIPQRQLNAQEEANRKLDNIHRTLHKAAPAVGR